MKRKVPKGPFYRCGKSETLMRCDVIHHMVGRSDRFRLKKLLKIAEFLSINGDDVFSRHERMHTRIPGYALPERAIQFDSIAIPDWVRVSDFFRVCGVRSHRK